MGIASSLRVASRTPLLQVLKTSAAVILAWVLAALLLGEPLPIFAAIAALLVVQPSLNQSVSKGIERSVGVVVGVLIAYGAGLVFGRESWVVLAVIVVALLLAWALKLGPGSANQIPISAMLVLALGTSSPEYAIERVIETVIGALIALTVNIAIVPPVLLMPAHVAVHRLLREVAATLDHLAECLTEPVDDAELDLLLERARELREPRDRATAAVAVGRESLMLNPRKGRHRVVLEADEQLLSRLNVLVTRVVGMARALHDHYDSGLRDEPTVSGIGRELRRAAHDLRLLGRNPEELAESTATAEIPALTAPLSIAAPHPAHWVLIGSLLEDMRRVREVIIGESDA